MWAGSVVVACACCANWVNLARSAWGGVLWVCEVPAGIPKFVGEKGLLHTTATCLFRAGLLEPRFVPHTKIKLKKIDLQT